MGAELDHTIVRGPEQRATASQVVEMLSSQPNGRAFPDVVARVHVSSESRWRQWLTSSAQSHLIANVPAHRPDRDAVPADGLRCGHHPCRSFVDGVGKGVPKPSASESLCCSWSLTPLACTNVVVPHTSPRS